jgi:nitroreductase
MNIQTWETFIKINAARRVVKYFTGEDVSDEDMIEILSAARLAPSGVGGNKNSIFFTINNKHL